MNTTHHAMSVTTSFTERVATVVSTDTQRLLTLGRERCWDSAVLGQAPLPDIPVRVGDWLVAPVHQDSSQIPARTLERVQAIYAAGLRPRGFVLVHEAPLLLSAPAENKSSPLRMSALPPQLKSALGLVAGALGIVAAGLVLVLGVVVLVMAALAAVAVLVIPAMLVTGAVFVDPILVAVTEDGYWIEIDRWVNEGKRTDDQPADATL